MLSPRENFLIAARGGVPEYIPSFMDDAAGIFPWFWTERDEEGRDFLGVYWTTNEAGAMPDHRDGKIVLNDIRAWREVMVFPDPDSLDWEGRAQGDMLFCSPDKAKISMLHLAGPFLLPVYLLGWTGALCAVYEEPKELKAMVDTIADYAVEMVPYQKKYYDPDIMFTGDDVSNSLGPFIAMDVWRDFYAPAYKRIVDAIHGAGCLVDFHCCGNCDAFLEEFVALGVDIAELWPETEKVRRAKASNGGAWSLIGGFDRQGPGNAPNAPEEVVRKAVRDGIDGSAPGGGFIFWDGGVVGESEDAQNKRRWIADEVANYGRDYYKRIR